jgi:nucleotide-binding universal stress UspA family protein
MELLGVSGLEGHHIMLNHLLIVFETDKEDNHALAHAVRIAHASGARITLLRLLDWSADKGRLVDPLDWHMRELEVKLSLGELRQKLQKAGIAAHTEVVHSSEAGNLLRYVEAQAVDLIILVKRTENISDLIHNCIKSASIPVLVLQAAGSPPNVSRLFRKLLVPLDSSQRAEYALSFAAQFAQIFNTEIVVAHVLHKSDTPRSIPPSLADQALSNQIVENNRNKVIPYLKQIAARLPGKVETRLLMGDNVAVTLANLAEQEQIDLIVLCAHGFSGRPQQPYGNITNSLMTYSQKPVLVVQDLPEAQTAPTQSVRHSMKALSSS